MTGDMTGNSTDTCLYCGQKNFVNVFKESMKNEIELITLKKKTRWRIKLWRRYHLLQKEKVEEIVKTIPTPFHIYDEKGIRENAQKLKDAFA